MAETVLKMKHITKAFPGVKALDSVSLAYEKGEVHAMVGENGAGKSTTISMMCGTLIPDNGSIHICGLDALKQIREITSNIGVVFQDFRLLNDRNVYENVAFAQRVVQTPSSEIRRNVPAILATVGLAGKYKAKTKQLSGGEQQRVALARALINNPSILLADEPTGNLDPKNSWEIMRLLEEINERGTTVVVVTHNREIVNAMRKRVVTMKKGVIVSDEEGGEYIDED